jgi:hypothetical protein
MLRKRAVGKFVEFYGDGLNALSPADRANYLNMALNTSDHRRFPPSTKRRLSICA